MNTTITPMGNRIVVRDVEVSRALPGFDPIVKASGGVRFAYVAEVGDHLRVHGASPRERRNSPAANTLGTPIAVGDQVLLKTHWASRSVERSVVDASDHIVGVDDVLAFWEFSRGSLHIRPVGRRVAVSTGFWSDGVSSFMDNTDSMGRLVAETRLGEVSTLVAVSAGCARHAELSGGIGSRCFIQHAGSAGDDIVVARVGKDRMLFVPERNVLAVLV
jgi:co-chaperonin GroES (HSP10)